MVLVEQWKKLSHSNLVSLRQVFTSKAFGDQSMFFIYDFFAGAGGFSTGARQAGCRVVYACDNNADALATHKRNHPEAEHACLGRQDQPEAEHVV